MSSASSTFYGLPVIAPGTAEVESLRSYVQRLAYAHSVAPGRLVSELLARHPLQEVSQTSVKNALESWGISGPGEVVEALMSRLQKATHKDLRSTAATRFGHVFAPQRLTRAPKLMHCPECVKEETWQGMAYGRLSWELAPVTCCPRHRVKLVDSRHCGAADRQPLPISRRPVLPGVCARCGSIGFACRAEPEERASDEEVWVAEQVQALLALTADESLALDATTMRKGIAATIEAAFEGKVVNAALSSGLGRTSVLAWVNEERLPSLDSLLKFCWRARAGLVPLLRGTYCRSETAGGETSDTLSKRRYSREARDWGAIRAMLLAEAEKDEPRTLGDLAEELGMWARNIRLVAPAEYKLLAERSKQHQAALAQRKLDQLKSAYRSAAEKLVADGVRVTKTNVIAGSGMSTFTGRSRIRHNALREVLAEFGVAMVPTGPSLGLRLQDASPQSPAV